MKSTALDRTSTVGDASRGAEYAGPPGRLHMSAVVRPQEMAWETGIAGDLTSGPSRLQFPDRRHSPLAIMPGGGAGRRVSTECPRRHRDGWRVIESIVCPPATCGRMTAGESSKSSGLLDNSTTCQKPVTAHHGRIEESIWALVETYSQKAPEEPHRVKRRGSRGVPSELEIDRTAASPSGRSHTNGRWRV